MLNNLQLALDNILAVLTLILLVLGAIFTMTTIATVVLILHTCRSWRR